ncbi:MAG: diguanylate cyclase [Ilumatobacteraceae bacterium]
MNREAKMAGATTTRSTADVHPLVAERMQRLGLRLDVPPDGAGWSRLLSELTRLEQESQHDRRRAAVAIADALVDPSLVHLVDPLCGLANAEGFDQALRHALRGTDGTDAAVLVVALRGLDRAMGRLEEAGRSELLLDAAERIRGVVRQIDVVGRLSGDEFAVLLGGLADTRSLGSVSRRLEQAFAEPLSAAGHYVYLSVAIGAALARPGSSAADAMRRGRVALDAATALPAARLAVR